LLYISSTLLGTRGGALVEALRYKPEGRGFDSGLCHCRSPYGRTMALGSTQPQTEMSTRIFSGGKGGRCVRLTTLPPSCADCLEIWQPQAVSTLRVCPDPYRDCFTFYHTSATCFGVSHTIFRATYLFITEN